MLKHCGFLIFFLLLVSSLEAFVAMLDICLLKSLKVVASIRTVSLHRDEFFPVNNQVAYYRVVFQSSLQASFKKFSLRFLFPIKPLKKTIYDKCSVSPKLFKDNFKDVFLFNNSRKK